VAGHTPITHADLFSLTSGFFDRTAITDCDALTRQNVQMWSDAPQEVRHQYGEVYFRAYLAKLAKMLRHSSEKIHEVVDDLTHAVTSAHPYTRYVAALFTNQLPADIFGASPNHFQDLVLSRILQVPASTAVMCNEKLDERKCI